MYGNYEYGSVPYGDSYVTVTVVIITKNNLDVIFMADRRGLFFLSQDKIALFVTSDPHTTTFIASKKDIAFLSPKRQATFISDDKTGKRCGN